MEIERSSLENMPQFEIQVEPNIVVKKPQILTDENKKRSRLGGMIRGFIRTPIGQKNHSLLLINDRLCGRRP